VELPLAAALEEAAALEAAGALEEPEPDPLLQAVSALSPPMATAISAVLANLLLVLLGAVMASSGDWFVPLAEATFRCDPLRSGVICCDPGGVRQPGPRLSWR
jgi:hypothetical protein